MCVGWRQQAPNQRSWLLSRLPLDACGVEVDTGSNARAVEVDSGTWRYSSPELRYGSPTRMGLLSHHPYQASAPTRLTRVKCRRWGVQTHGPDQPYQPLAARLLFFSNVCKFAWVSDHGAGAHARQHGQAREEARRNEGGNGRRKTSSQRPWG